MRLTLLFVAGCLVACGPNDRNNSGNPDATASDTGSGSGDAPPATDTSRVYAQSKDTLYAINTATLAANVVGPMTPVVNTESITDIAVDKDHHMVGISLKNLYAINPDTGAILSTKPLDATAKNFTSLSYIPAANPQNPDVLVSANSFGDVFSIDPAAGTATVIGNYGKTGSDQIGSSGDLIGIAGLGIFATVDVGTTDANDYLAQIDPTTYKATLIGTGTGYNKIFGLGFWAGKIYGFVDLGSGAGKIIEIDRTTGVGHDLASNAIEWFGAGVETTAPIIQ